MVFVRSLAANDACQPEAGNFLGAVAQFRENRIRVDTDTARRALNGRPAVSEFESDQRNTDGLIQARDGNVVGEDLPVVELRIGDRVAEPFADTGSWDSIGLQQNFPLTGSLLQHELPQHGGFVVVISDGRIVVIRLDHVGTPEQCPQTLHLMRIASADHE